MGEWKFDDNSIEVFNAIENVADQWIKDATRVLLNKVIQNTRVDTSKTKESWKSVTEKYKGIVGSTEKNAIYEEFGTGHYALNGDGEKKPWYVYAGKILGKKRPTLDGKVVIVYGKNGKQYYKTNGKAPSRPLYRAKNSIKDEIEVRLKDLIRKNLK